MLSFVLVSLMPCLRDNTFNALFRVRSPLWLFKKLSEFLSGSMMLCSTKYQVITEIITAFWDALFSVFYCYRYLSGNVVLPRKYFFRLLALQSYCTYRNVKWCNNQKIRGVQKLHEISVHSYLRDLNSSANKAYPKMN